MKKFLIAAAAAGLIIFGGQNTVDAASVENLDVQGVETQEVSWWTHFRDKHILGRETENERRDRKEWERRHRDDRRDWDRHRDDRRDHRPPPPHGRHHNPPPSHW